ncbi:MAG: CRISPR system precrRNA processing endoribonuclease RAMP protein Cas6 [Candidatus Phosphoribacter sp.]|nr:CRISPR system precrRNA processing endoribonuclease RAMP protein Cas6 [Actinomycetales bacterium]
MPSRWFVPLAGIDPHRVQLHHVHAAVSRWFDRGSEHWAGEKPYAVSPLVERDGRVGVEVGLLGKPAHERFAAVAADVMKVKLGPTVGRLGRPVRLRQRSWEELARQCQARSWTLELLTPTTFRSGDRSTPLPEVQTVLSGLARSWQAWCPEPDLLPLPGPAADPAPYRAVWVSDLRLTSSVTELQVRGRDGIPRIVLMSGVTGTMHLRADDDAAARWAGPLLALAPFAGVGSMRAKGFGVVDVTARPGEATGERRQPA